jgi:glycosyltransferase involved in cell wall biosynthesis
MNNISVIISTYNGAEKLPVLLEALIEQTISDFEVVVMVDGSTDSTLEVLQQYKDRFKSFRFRSQENSGRSRVRNRGVKEASGNLLIFFDDDMKPYPDAIERYANMYDGQEKLVAGNQIEFVEPGKTDIQNYKAVRAQGWVAKYTQPVMQLNVHNLFFTAATCSMTRSVFDKLGGFDERLTDAEDYNLARRALDKNIPVYFDRHNKSVHRDFITARSYVLRLREYQLAQERLLELYPQHKRFGPQRSVAYKRLVYRLFAFPFWIKRIDQHSLLFLPERLRYKLYDIIIQALAIEYPAINV